MRDFNRGNRFGGGRSSAPRNSYGRGEGRPSMYKAVCSSCGNSCEVPFRPTGSKPVYCSQCFEKSGNAAPRRDDRRRDDRDFGRSNFERSDSERKRMFSVTCDSCGNDCEVPFRPTKGKPVYCSDCFGKESKGGNGGGNRAPDQSKQQFEMLNIKLDRILKLLTPVVVPTKPVKKVKEKVVVEAKKKPKSKKKKKD